MNAVPGGPETVVLARGDLAVEDAAQAVRLSLALPLAGLRVRLVLADGAAMLALAELPDLTPWGGNLAAELPALLEEDVAIVVEKESLVRLGLEGRALRPGIELRPGAEIIALCAQAACCLVL
ncbi:MAG: DsrE family protein [Candidatus Dormibacteria bacterium]